MLSNAKTRVERREHTCEASVLRTAKHITMLRIVESLNAALHVHALRRGVYSNRIGGNVFAYFSPQCRPDVSCAIIFSTIKYCSKQRFSWTKTARAACPAPPLPRQILPPLILQLLLLLRLILPQPVLPRQILQLLILPQPILPRQILPLLILPLHPQIFPGRLNPSPRKTSNT